MTPLDDHSQRRRPLFFPVVIATALLTIIGMVGGYLLGQERDREESDGAEPTPSPVLIATGPACPDQTQKMGAKQGADGELRQVMWVRTNRKTEVWICEDRSGRLFYHANKGGTEAEWIEGKTALFLTGVWSEGDGRYAAQAFDGNIFSVDRKRLLISYADGDREEQKVVES
ncbi:hypothetical protein [Actinoplanes aureus]|uniref:hypothetical protein n=1 Tax=Actinoplanes aureus TaxID=2792083 RepID=UPI0028161AE9|nr:hypothetical protein [Actinoplanes aureus]